MNVDLLKLRNAAIGTAMRKGLPYPEAQDFASFVLIRILSGKSNRDLKYQFLDYLRSEFGRYKGKIPPIGRRDEIPIASVPEEQLTSEFDDPTCELIQFCEENKIIDQRRVVFILYLKFGFTFQEIGDVLNVCEARVCQIFTAIKVKINGSARHRNITQNSRFVETNQRANKSITKRSS